MQGAHEATLISGPDTIREIKTIGWINGQQENERAVGPGQRQNEFHLNNLQLTGLFKDGAAAYPLTGRLARRRVRITLVVPGARFIAATAACYGLQQTGGVRTLFRRNHGGISAALTNTANAVTTRQRTCNDRRQSVRGR